MECGICRKWFSSSEANKRICASCERKKLNAKTNGDLFRAMTNEELAVTLMCPNEMGMADIPCDHSDDKNCCKCLLDWLQQPAEED